MFDLLPDKDLTNCLNFLIEIDALKKTLRKTSIVGGERLENSAEHSWHLMMMAVVLQRYANEPVDLLKVLKMLCLHDLGEIEGEDVFLYDDENRLAAEASERRAAEKLFSSLPNDTRQEFMTLWDEFTHGQTPESRFARALDRFQPFLTNVANQGGTWKTLKITHSKALEKNKHIGDGAAPLWEVYQTVANAMKEKFFYSSSKE